MSFESRPSRIHYGSGGTRKQSKRARAARLFRWPRRNAVARRLEALEPRLALSLGGPYSLSPADLGIGEHVQPVPVANGMWFLGNAPAPGQMRLLEPFNVNAADTTNADQLRTGGGLGLDLTGSGVTVGVWDGGRVRNTHQEFGSRVSFGDGVSSFSDHATHVAGTIGASGVNASARGMATQVNIVSYNFNNDLAEMDAAPASILASNHSYGAITGWTSGIDWGIGPVDTWFQDRDLYSVEDPVFGKYDSSARDLDQVLVDHPSLVSFWSAGNDRIDLYGNLQGNDTYVTYLSQSGGSGPGYYIVPTSSYPAPPRDGGTSGFDTLAGDKNAKNSVVVGAINDITADPYTSASVVATSFSSFGSTDDGRVKPDVVGNGANLFSAFATSNTAYGTFSGTSMSSPNVTGSAALLIEHFQDLYGTNPRAATTKGLLTHTAFDGGNVGPDYKFGWGVVDAARAANFLTTSSGSNPTDFFQETVYTGSEQTITVVSDGSGPLKASIVWTDLPGTAHGSGVDITTPVLVHDLDLWITDGGGTYHPWTLDPSNPNSAAVQTQANHLDNVEQVLIASPAAGTYTIHIGHTGTSFTNDYTLLVSGAAIATGLADIHMQSVTADGGTVLTVQYEVLNGPVSEFDVELYRSADMALGGDTLLATIHMSGGDLSTGPHTNTYTIGGSLGEVALPGTTTPEVDGDYFILAVADPTDAVAEDDAHPTDEDNTAVFSGVYHPAAGDVFVHGRSVADAISASGSLDVDFNGVVYAYSASDVSGLRVRGNGGNDTFDGSTIAKPMWLYGGDGNDTLTGGTVADMFTGGAGNDTQTGGTGDDTYLFDVDSALGTDTLNESGGGSDTLDFSATTGVAITVNLATAGTQTVNGNLSFNLQSATTFEDAVGGSAGDTITGNTLANRITGGPGNDTLKGAAGNDVYFFDADSGLGTDTLNESGGGNDTLDFSATSTIAVTVSLAISGAQVVNSNLTLSLGSTSTFENATGGDLADTLTGNTQVNILVGGPGNDTLTGNSGNDTLTGGAGDDTLTGNAGNDTYPFDTDSGLGSDTINEAGGGTDTLDFSATSTLGVTVNLATAAAQVVNTNLTLTLSSASTMEHAIGGDQADTLTGNTLANSLTGGLGNDTLIGSSGNDTLTGGGDNDSLIGGAGNDIYPFDTDNGLGSDTVNEAGGGTDTLNFSATSSLAIVFSLASTAAQPVNGNLTLTLLSASNVENLTGGAMGDTLTGNTLANTLTGGAGDDSMAGASGNDTYVFDADGSLGSDTLDESGGGTDTLSFGSTTTVGVTVDLGLAGAQTVHNGNLTLTLGSATEFENVVGGSQADTLTGNTLANSLTGGPGNDTLTGAAGNDTYLFDADGALGTDTLNETGGATDTLSFTATTGKTVALDLSQSGSQVVNSNLSLVLSSGITFENIVGGSLNDTLIGNTLDNVLTGGPGADTQSGGAGNDTLIGSAGNDTYLFDADGALGSDTLNEAGGGADTLDFSATTGATVTLNLSQAATQVVNSNLTLTLSSATVFEHIVGGSLNDSLTGNTLANTLTGGPGNDMLTGLAGNDTLIGGADNDTYQFDADSALGSDTLNESGGGIDTLDFGGTGNLGVVANLGTAGSQVVNANLTLTLGSASTFEKVIGSSQNDTITGNTLANILLGGAGADTVSGGSGRDLIFGGLGGDTLTGGADDDILISGTTSYDADPASLEAILAVWVGADDYPTRTTNLRNGVGGPQLAAGITVFDDAAADSLTGGTELDWFFAALADGVADQESGELIESL